MTLHESVREPQQDLLRAVHTLWSALPIPRWERPTSEPNGWEPEHVEISRYLAGCSYEAARDFCCSESLFIWCKPEIASYYLGGHLLHAIENLAEPCMRDVDFWISNLNGFLAIDPLYREVYAYLSERMPAAIPIVRQYGDLLELCRRTDPPEGWMETSPWPDEPELIKRLRTHWRDIDAFRKAIETLPPL
jgi:hypothetical protein